MMVVKSPISQFREWLAANLCSGTGEGEPCINVWIFDAVRASRRFDVSSERVEELIEPLLTRKQKGREIAHAIRTVYEKPYTGTGRKSRETEARFNIEKLERRASRIDIDITQQWLAERSPVPVDIPPAAFLHLLYRQNERVWIGTRKNERRGSIWINDDPEDIACLDSLRTGHIVFGDFRRQNALHLVGKNRSGYKRENRC